MNENEIKINYNDIDFEIDKVKKLVEDRNIPSWLSKSANDLMVNIELSIRDIKEYDEKDGAIDYVGLPLILWRGILWRMKFIFDFPHLQDFFSYYNS